MKNIKNVNSLFVLMLGVALLFTACKKEEDEGKLPSLKLKIDMGYIYEDQSVAAKADLKFGVIAEKAEEKDPLIRLDISRSINGADATSIQQVDLSGANGDYYEADFTFQADSVSGHVNTYTFTVTNRDGLINQKTVKITIE